MKLPQIVETLVTAAEDPLDSEGLAAAIRQAVAIRAAELAEGEPLPDHLLPFAETTAAEVEHAIGELNASYVVHGNALAVVHRPRGWQLMTRPEFADYLAALFPERRTHRLSSPALETLAIIAYRQPVTKAEIESVRGVSADGMLQKLLDLELVKIGGRAELPGRPLQYVTTGKFLEHFNLRQVDELPNAQELRRVKLPSAAEVHGTNPEGETPVAEAGETAPVEVDLPAIDDPGLPVADASAADEAGAGEAEPVESAMEDAAPAADAPADLADDDAAESINDDAAGDDAPPRES